jgi:hypothetical protein
LASITEDPAGIALTEVNREATWAGYGNYMNVYSRDGDCYEHSSVTTWYVDDCDQSVTYSTLYLDDEQSGEFHNDDFPWPGEPDTTYVFSQAGLEAWDSDWVNWWTYWTAWGEASYLLDEAVGHDYEPGSNCS